MKNILIVDDSESICELMKLTLESAGYRVDQSADGPEAVRCLDGREINLVITDLYMPMMDGIELIREIRNHNDYATTPILLLTTELQAAKKEEAREAGATAWIVKPFMQEKLLEVVKKIIR